MKINNVLFYLSALNVLFFNLPKIYGDDNTIFTAEKIKKYSDKYIPNLETATAYGAKATKITLKAGATLICALFAAICIYHGLYLLHKSDIIDAKKFQFLLPSSLQKNLYPKLPSESFEVIHNHRSALPENFAQGQYNFVLYTPIIHEDMPRETIIPYEHSAEQKFEALIALSFGAVALWGTKKLGVSTWNEIQHPALSEK